jgi:hypothetical protein
VKRLLLIVLLSGCAYRIQQHPSLFEGCLLYCRISDCTAKDIPTPLQPSASDPVNGIPPLLRAPKPSPGGTIEEGKMAVQGDDTHCTTLEVGAKSYSDTLMALGMALGAIYAKIHGLF